MTPKGRDMDIMHMAIGEMLDGTAVQWMAKVADEQCGGDGGVREE